MPSVSEKYDKECQIVRKKVELTVEQVQAFEQLNCGSSHECKNQFLGQVIGATLIFPVSVVISGSIAVIGNTMYWLKAQHACKDSHNNSHEQEETQAKKT